MDSRDLKEEIRTGKRAAVTAMNLLQVLEWLADVDGEVSTTTLNDSLGLSRIVRVTCHKRTRGLEVAVFKPTSLEVEICRAAEMLRASIEV